MDTKRCHVRLTEKAHDLLAKRTKGSGISMKDAASEAIIQAFHKNWDNKLYALGTFALGAIAGGALMFVIGVML